MSRVWVTIDGVLAVYPNQFVLAPSPLRLTTIDIIFFNRILPVMVLMEHLLCREDGFASYEYAWASVKCTYRTYSILMKTFSFALHTSPLPVQALQSRSCLSYVSYATTASSHLNFLNVDHRQVIFSVDSQLTILVITSLHGPRRKHRYSLL
jgi:hypothetical protein